MKRLLTTLLILSAMCFSAIAQENVNINVKSKAVAGQIDPMLYGQLFEHIYFSANNGVWQELIYERSFEPEHYPGIHPRDGFFDGWHMDDEDVLHSPTRYEQPIHITTVNTDNYEINMDVKWRSYRLARRSWSGGLMDMRFAVKNAADGKPYYVRVHNPYYEARILNPGQTEAQAAAAAMAQAQQAMQQQVDPYFGIAKMVERETEFRGTTRKINTLESMVSKKATAAQINENQDWHKLRIVCAGKSIKVYWDGKNVVSYSKLESSGKNDIDFWVNYTEAYYKNIRVTSSNGKVVYFQGTPEDVKIPSVAPQWDAFGNATYELVKGDAINMDYSQKITAGASPAGVSQGPQNLISGETFLGSIYAKGNGTLSVGLKRGNNIILEQNLGVPGNTWTKYDINLPLGSLSGDADFAIIVKNGTVQVDQATLTTKTGQSLGGFRPDIFNAVKELHPTCLRWPGGGYVAQYYWQWGVGPQEQRYRWPHWQWMDYDQNCFGTDEFIRFCREIGAEPVIVVSVHFERPAEEYDSILQDAVNWVRYCNEPATGEWGAKRAANGHPEPYNVKYWEIDNEMWEMGIERYEKCVRDFSTAMREVSPDIKIIVCGGFDDEDFFKRSGTYFDYVSLHHYEQQGGYFTGPRRLAEQYDRYAQYIANCPNPNLKLFISEWNLQSIDWRTGLFAGGFLNVCEERDVVAMGAAALFIRRTDAPDWNNAFINFDYKDLFVAPNYQVTNLWYDHFSRYRLDFTGDVKDLSVVTTLSENGKEVIVKVVNATEKPYKLNIAGDWNGIDGAKYEYYAPGSLTVANSMENKNAVALKVKNLNPANNGIALDIDPLSAGVITIERKF
jgi:alpha-N-arabinofuranosidase